MQYFDNLYGSISIEDYYQEIIHSPELQRLREVGLINSKSPKYSSLSEVTRFTHTLGVFYLSQLLKEQQKIVATHEEIIAFNSAILLHDIGSPAFGHLLEYQFQTIKNWSHQ